MNFADIGLVVYIGIIIISSTYFLYQFRQALCSGEYRESLAPPLLLSLSDFFLYLVGFALCYWYAQEWLIVYSLGSIVLIMLLRGIQPLSFWKLEAGQVPSYFLKGSQAYLTIFIPLTLLTVVCSMLFSLFGFEDLAQPAVQMLLDAKDLKTIAAFLFSACVVAPLWEEITFRGFLYPFLKSRCGNMAALTISSLLFAAMHQHPPSFIPLTLLGLGLGLIYDRTGSLGYSIFFHGVFNAATCLVLLFIKYGSHPEWAHSM